MYARDSSASGAHSVVAVQHDCEMGPSRAHSATSRTAGRHADAEIVCRGIQLILDGGLDDDNGERLAARLGVSHRQLRRLFQLHAGITPDQLAQSSRAHFARRMLDETSLPVADIAFVSGFGSLRQFDRTMSTIFGATPVALRARRRSNDHSIADGGLVVRLGTSTSLEWHANLAHLSTHAFAGVESIGGDTYRRTIVTERASGVIEIHLNTSGELLLRAHLPDWHEVLHVIQKARGIFNLDEEFEASTRVGIVQPTTRLPGTWDPFEIGVRAIIGQNRSASDARAIASRIVERFGQHTTGFSQWGLTHTFPPAHIVGRATLDDVGLSASESATVSMFANAVGDGDVQLDRNVRADDAVRSLLAIPGIEPITAECIARRSCRPDA